jgi:predicted phage tail component-like protein
MAHMTFSGVASSDLHFDYASPRIPLLPSKRPTTVEVAGRDGSVDFDNDSYTPRIIPVDCLIHASSKATLDGYMAAAAKWLSGSGYLVFDYDTTKQWYGKVYSIIDLDYAIPLYHRFTVYFECRPYAEDVTETTGATIGVEDDYESDATFYPEINIALTDDAAFVQVTLSSTGQYVRIEDAALANGDDIVIDMSTGKATVNDVYHAVTIQSLFFGVPPGNQTITVTATSTFTASMDYRKRYYYA